jgi:hypothetical protein
MTTTANQGAAALTRFRELAEHADAEGDALLGRYKAEGDDVAAGATAGQLRWLRSRRELVLDGELLPGGQHSFSLTRMFADFEHGADGDAFQRAT